MALVAQPQPTHSEQMQEGINTEARFFSALQSISWNAPGWFKSVRRATHLEDSEGIDPIITIDAGEVHVQIKSSPAGVRKHHNYHGNKQMVFFIESHYTEVQIRAILERFLYRRREQMYRAVRARR